MSKSHQFIDQALDNVASAFWIMDDQLTETRYINRSFREFFSIPLDRPIEEISVRDCMVELGRVFGTIDTPDGQPEAARARLMSVQHFDTVMKTKDGRHIKLERFPDMDGHTTVTFSDVTTLVLAMEKAKAAELAKTQFIANMSHEIRTPMNGVVGMAQVLNGTQLSDRQKDYVGIISRSGEALLSIINDILDFSKLQSGKFGIEPNPFNFREMIDDVIILLGHTAREKDIELVLNMPHHLEYLLLGDAGRIRQTLINMIGNAIKFTRDGYVKLRVNMTEEEGYVAIDFAIKDTGIGIAEDKIESIFHQFEQADSSTTRDFGGTGLGLSISQQLVSLMGGEIAVKSKIGAGSIFSFTLELPKTDIKISPPSVVSQLPGTPIMVLDDMPVNHMVMKDQLTLFGAKPICVDTATKALAILRKVGAKKLTFPLVITDFQMPEMSGLDFVKAVRADPLIAKTPIMVLSSVDMTPYRSEFTALGVTHVYEKPFLSHNLHKSVYDILSENGLSKLKKMVRHAKSAQAVSGVPPVPGAADKRIKVLAADDDEVNRIVLEQMLSGGNIDVTLVMNGMQAVERYKQEAFDVVLMDISMPIMDGIEAVKEIRAIEDSARARRIPIIATTAHTLKGDRERFIAAGMDDYIPKPIRHAVLIKALEKWAGIDKAKRLKSA